MKNILKVLTIAALLTGLTGCAANEANISTINANLDNLSAAIESSVLTGNNDFFINEFSGYDVSSEYTMGDYSNYSYTGNSVIDDRINEIGSLYTIAYDVSSALQNYDNLKIQVMEEIRQTKINIANEELSDILVADLNNYGTTINNISSSIKKSYSLYGNNIDVPYYGQTITTPTDNHSYRKSRYMNMLASIRTGTIAMENALTTLSIINESLTINNAYIGDTVMDNNYADNYVDNNVNDNVIDNDFCDNNVIDDTLLNEEWSNIDTYQDQTLPYNIDTYKNARNNVIAPTIEGTSDRTIFAHPHRKNADADMQTTTRI